MLPEDWSSIAAEVTDALRSVADTSQPGGYPATLRIPPGGPPANPWEPPSDLPTYAELVVVQDTRELKDVNGTLIGQTVRTLMCSATGVVPSDDWTIAVGVGVADVTDDTVFEEIMAVRPLAPAGIAILYEIDLAG
ncbi:hypothetical protein [Devosia lacusdianchii]|uniref:hypothetical protein n=1 Tax=Devosia lacusdianchii TaxID=2917991 RepID=UPI001F0703A2|nr:hypothetical protein [Devosia sp. JXJ CY 41]